MKLSGVRLSVCPVIRPPHAAAAGLLLWARRPGDILDCCTAGAPQQMQAVSRCDVAKRRRVLYAIVLCKRSEYFRTTVTTAAVCLQRRRSSRVLRKEVGAHNSTSP